MKRTVLIAALAAAVWGQDDAAQQEQSPREALRRAMADLRGQYDDGYPVLPRAREVEQFSPFVPWTLAAQDKSRTPASTVSAARLRHKVPKNAMKAYDRGVKFSGKGDVLRATQELERAVTLDPEFAEAYNDLGVAYVRLARFRPAEAAFERAVALDPESSLAASNLAWVLFELRKLPEAERSARRALKLWPNNARAHVVLGVMLGAVPATRAEAVEHLKQAAGMFPDANKVIEELRGK